MVVSWWCGRFDAATRSAVGSLEWWLRTVPLIGAASLHELMLLRPAWSLDFEAQFYLVAPLIVSTACDGRRRALLWMAAVLMGAAFAAGYAVLPGTVLQFGGFFIAGVLCERGGWVPGRRLLGFSQPAFAGALLWLAVATVMKQGGAGVDAFPAGTQHWCEMLIVLAGMPMAIGSCRMPSDATDRHLGNLAFPLYLVHDAVDIVFERLALNHGLGWKLATLPLQWFLMAAAAAVLYFWVDRPIDRLRQRWISFCPRKEARE
jgi:peptidoglycan/LPS O-acetylase OafA/YrhL